MIDLSRQKFGRWTVQGFVGRQGHDSYWDCLCDCGNTSRVRGNDLKIGHSQSCGCYNRERVAKRRTTHGHTKNGLVSREYRRWRNMMTRCYNTKVKSYKDYGARGIKVCERWHTFENFFEDVGVFPDGLTLDRVDNSGDYTPDNWRFATQEEQKNNKRSNAWYEYKGENRTVAQWSRLLGIKQGTLLSRLKKPGWSIERALTTPVIRRGPNHDIK